MKYSIFASLLAKALRFLDLSDAAMLERERARREAYLSQATDLVHLEYLERQYDRHATHRSAFA